MSKSSVHVDTLDGIIDEIKNISPRMIGYKYVTEFITFLKGYTMDSINIEALAFLKNAIMQNGMINLERSSKQKIYYTSFYTIIHYYTHKCLITATKSIFTELAQSSDCTSDEVSNYDTIVNYLLNLKQNYETTYKTVLTTKISEHIGAKPEDHYIIDRKVNLYSNGTWEYIYPMKNELMAAMNQEYKNLFKNQNVMVLYTSMWTIFMLHLRTIPNVKDGVKIENYDDVTTPTTISLIPGANKRNFIYEAPEDNPLIRVICFKLNQGLSKIQGGKIKKSTKKNSRRLKKNKHITRRYKRAQK